MAGPARPTAARTRERSKSQREIRVIQTAPVTAEEVGFPLVAQAAQLLRRTSGKLDELVALVTSAQPERLSPAQWLQFNRQAWGIENGLHQRLDASFGDDQARCRARRRSGPLGSSAGWPTVWPWTGARRGPRKTPLTVADFRTAMAAHHGAGALRLLLNRHPSLKPRS